MSLWSRVANVFRGEKLTSEIAEEMDSHIAEAVERGRDPDEARRAFGHNYQQRQQKRLAMKFGVCDGLSCCVPTSFSAGGSSNETR
jgi:putative ABC transport system permease protein